MAWDNIEPFDILPVHELVLKKPIKIFMFNVTVEAHYLFIYHSTDFKPSQQNYNFEGIYCN